MSARRDPYTNVCWFWSLQWCRWYCRMSHMIGRWRPLASFSARSTTAM